MKFTKLIITGPSERQRDGRLTLQQALERVNSAFEQVEQSMKTEGLWSEKYAPLPVSRY